MVVVSSRYDFPEVGMILAEKCPDDEAVKALGFTVGKDDAVYVFAANPNPPVEI